MRALENRKICSAPALIDLAGANRASSRAGENHFAARASRDPLRKRIVSVQNDRSFGANGLCKRAFLLRNSFARSHKLDMRDTNVCNDADVGRSYFRQRRNFTGV